MEDYYSMAIDELAKSNSMYATTRLIYIGKSLWRSLK